MNKKPVIEELLAIKSYVKVTNSSELVQAIEDCQEQILIQDAELSEIPTMWVPSSVDVIVDNSILLFSKNALLTVFGTLRVDGRASEMTSHAYWKGITCSGGDIITDYLTVSKVCNFAALQTLNADVNMTKNTCFKDNQNIEIVIDRSRGIFDATMKGNCGNRYLCNVTDSHIEMGSNIYDNWFYSNLIRWTDSMGRITGEIHDNNNDGENIVISLDGKINLEIDVLEYDNSGPGDYISVLHYGDVKGKIEINKDKLGGEIVGQISR